MLDEIDRMQREEILVLLKILRGASSIPNVTFVCALAEDEVRETAGLPPQYFEKFFPVSISLTPPDPEMIGKFLESRLQHRLREQQWFKEDQESIVFGALFANLWEDSLRRTCTNLRKARLLLNDVLGAGGPIAGEVNCLDLVIIEAIRRFAPAVHRILRHSAGHLTDARKNPYFHEEQEDTKEFFTALNHEVDRAPEPNAVRILLCWLFPKYASTSGSSAAIMGGARRPIDDKSLEDEKRICVARYFQIYFRASVPEDMFSNTELDRLISRLNTSETPDSVQNTFNAILDSIPPGHPKRGDFLWRLARGAGRLTKNAGEFLAYAVALRAADYKYDVMNVGEGAYGQNVIFVVAQKVSSTPDVQRVLEGAITRPSDDTFAVRLLAGIENPSLNKITTDLSFVDATRLKLAFVERMRERYSRGAKGMDANLVQGEWLAFGSGPSFRKRIARWNRSSGANSLERAASGLPKWSISSTRRTLSGTKIHNH